MKTSKTYRLSQATLTAIDELQEMTGAASATEVLELAVARWHSIEQRRQALKLKKEDKPR